MGLLEAIRGQGQAVPRWGQTPNLGLSAAQMDYLMTQSWIARLAQSAAGAATLPGDVYAGRVNPMSDEGIGRSADLASLLTLGTGALPSTANDLRMGIKAYHGSPHKFDKFDLAKMGTGEGAQAKGWGVYLAENPEVAGTYRTAGRQIVNGPLGPVRNNKATGEAEFIGLWDRMFGSKGRMYSVDLNAHADDFLNLDAPLKAQSQVVRDALRERFPDVDSSAMTGMQAYEEIARGQAEANMWRQPWKKQDAFDQRYASEYLLNRGVKGNRYLDAGSRAAGDGTRNYVVFDPELISILGKK